MAPKKKREGDGILAKVTHMFNAGELNIPVDSALEKVSLCTKYKKMEGAIRVAKRYM